MLVEALIYLCAAVLSVPLAKRLGLGSVMGYLLAGVIIGPSILNLVGELDNVMHFAEFGIVMMLFLIGLELQPTRLWQMRKVILGLGGLQVILTAILITGILFFFIHLSWQSSLAIGLALALSSTAIVLQTLAEKGWLKNQAGSSSFSVLLFQDIAVIPILALLPLLALQSGEAFSQTQDNLLSDFPVWLQIIFYFATIALIIVGGRFLSAPVFRFIAESRMREIFTAVALLIVVAIAVLMSSIGLSPALGTFLAGAVLAESEFRHELEVDIEPFKGLLLGLFFMAIGASINFQLISEAMLAVAVSVIGLILLKMLVLAFLAKSFKLPIKQGLLFTLILAQGGEFAFVIAASAEQLGIFSQQTKDMLTLVVALSMLITPLLIVFYEWYVSRSTQHTVEPEPEEIIPSKQVILAGYGRFGQIVGRLLDAQGYQLTILDHNPSQIDMVGRFGNKIFYGDASRADLLHAAGAAEAKLLVIAVDEPLKTLQIIEVVKKHFPDLKILARAIDRRHCYELMRMNIDGMRRETFDSAVNLGVDALKIMGQSESDATIAGELFAQHDQQTLELLAEKWGDDKSYGIAVRQRLQDLRAVLISDRRKMK